MSTASTTPPIVVGKRPGGPELHLLPACGHLLTWERPDEVNALMLDWLGRLAPH
jgi:pimeloyl-ACP methyl ester carboxylesterase